MTSYKAEVTLNERDSLQDMLNLEKTLVKVYATAITEGCSKGFRTLIKDNLISTTFDQMQVFLLMTENDYYRVESAPEEMLNPLKEKFCKVKTQLS